MDPRAAIEWAGSQAELARRLGIRRASVSLWVAAGRVPEPRAYQIQVISKGAVKVDPSRYPRPTEAA
jgi:DNA-binding transcriptional regulator YdaS (Cro superfamily)